jgi:hypothetical protein
MVYRGTSYPNLYGWYICVDFYSANGWLIQPNGNGWNVQRQSGLPANIGGFGESEDGELYAVSLQGVVYQVQAPTVLAMKLESFTIVANSSEHILKWKAATEQQLQRFDVEYSTDGINFKNIAKVPAKNTSSDYQFNFRVPGTGKIYYRIKMVDHTGKEEYSNIIQWENTDSMVKIAPTLIRDNTVVLQLVKPFQLVEIVDMKGRTVKTKNLSQNTGTFYLDLSGLAKGMYTIRLTGNGTVLNRKIVIQ